MKISSLTTGFALLTSLLLSSCSLSATSSTDVSLVSNDEAATVKKTVKIGDFNSIDVSRGIKVIFVQGPNNGIASIATTPSAEKYLRVEVKYNKLKVYYSNEIGTKRINGPTIIKVSSPQLNEVDLSSAAQLKVDGNLVTKRDFFIELSSASSFEVGSLSCLNFDVELSSSASANVGTLIGDLDLGASSASSLNIGSVKGDIDADISSAASLNVGSLNGDFDAEASSTSSINIKALNSSSISAEASSAATITLSKISGGNIKASASSGAKVNLSGKANSLNKKSSSGGSVNHSKLTVSR